MKAGKRADEANDSASDDSFSECCITTMRLKILGNELIKIVGKSESCMVYKLPIIFKRTHTIHRPSIRIRNDQQERPFLEGAHADHFVCVFQSKNSNGQNLMSVKNL